MWIALNDAFFSIVSKDCARDEVLVRARRPGDIEKVWPEAKVTQQLTTDYRYRAIIKRTAVASALAGEVNRITYSNFKDSVADRPLHDAYLRVWSAMIDVQPTRPYTGTPTSQTPIRDYQAGIFAGLDTDPPLAPKGEKRLRRKAKRRSIKRGR